MLFSLSSMFFCSNLIDYTIIICAELTKFRQIASILVIILTANAYLTESYSISLLSYYLENKQNPNSFQFSSYDVKYV